MNKLRFALFSVILSTFAMAQAQVQDQVDLNSLDASAPKNYYEPIIRNPLWLLPAIFACVIVAIHMVKSKKRKAVHSNVESLFKGPKS